MKNAVGTARKSAASHFPYDDTTVTYLIAQEGRVFPITVDASTAAEVVNSEHKIYAVWPGKFTSDLFEIDKVELVNHFL